MTKTEILNLFFTSDVPQRAVMEISMSLVLAAIFGSLISLTYCRSILSRYNKIEFYFSLVLFCVISAAMTILISDNIVRAFALVGALSIVRFRTAIKSPLDITYLFWSLCLGMGFGSGQYLFGLVTFVIVALIIVIYTNIYSLFFKHNTIVYYKVKDLYVNFSDQIAMKGNLSKNKILSVTDYTSNDSSYCIISFSSRDENQLEQNLQKVLGIKIESRWKESIHI